MYFAAHEGYYGFGTPLLAPVNRTEELLYPPWSRPTPRMQPSGSARTMIRDTRQYAGMMIDPVPYVGPPVIHSVGHESPHGPRKSTSVPQPGKVFMPVSAPVSDAQGILDISWTNPAQASLLRSAELDRESIAVLNLSPHDVPNPHSEPRHSKVLRRIYGSKRQKLDVGGQGILPNGQLNRDISGLESQRSSVSTSSTLDSATDLTTVRKPSQIEPKILRAGVPIRRVSDQQSLYVQGIRAGKEIMETTRSPKVKAKSAKDSAKNKQSKAVKYRSEIAARENDPANEQVTTHNVSPAIVDPLSLFEDAFRTQIFPRIKTALRVYSERVSAEDLHQIGIKTAGIIVNDKLRDVFFHNNSRFSLKDLEKIEATAKETVDWIVSTSHKLSPVHKDIQVIDLDSDSPSEKDEVNSSYPQTVTKSQNQAPNSGAEVVSDLSLLGPGERPPKHPDKLVPLKFKSNRRHVGYSPALEALVEGHLRFPSLSMRRDAALKTSIRSTPPYSIAAGIPGTDSPHAVVSVPSVRIPLHSNTSAFPNHPQQLQLHENSPSVPETQNHQSTTLGSSAASHCPRLGNGLAPLAKESLTAVQSPSQVFHGSKGPSVEKQLSAVNGSETEKLRSLSLTTQSRRRAMFQRPGANTASQFIQHHQPKEEGLTNQEHLISRTESRHSTEREQNSAWGPRFHDCSMSVVDEHFTQNYPEFYSRSPSPVEVRPRIKTNMKGPSPLRQNSKRPENSLSNSPSPSPPAATHWKLDPAGKIDISQIRGGHEALIDASSDPVARKRRVIESSVEDVSLTHGRNVAALAGDHSRILRPYLSKKERHLLQSDPPTFHWHHEGSKPWEGQVLHVDFLESEMRKLQFSITQIYDNGSIIVPHICVNECLVQLLRGATEAQIAEMARHACRSRIFKNRTSDAIKSFLKDASDGNVSTHASFLRIAAKIADTPRDHHSSLTTSSLLRRRQLGVAHTRGGWNTPKAIHEELKLRTFDKLRPWRTWTGASNDVLVVAWAPDGNKYAAGASAESSIHNMQYNRQNNFLVGNLTSNMINELPDHRIDRPPPGAISKGPNSSQATYDACDPQLYMTVTGIQFAASGKRMYTSSYDHTVKIWDVSLRTKSRCIASLKHDDEVDAVALSSHHLRVLATGSRVLKNAIRVYNIYEDDEDDSCFSHLSLSSQRALDNPAKEIYPASVHWGIHPQVSNYLLAGFAPRPKDPELDTDDPAREGDLCVWDVPSQTRISVQPNSQNVFDSAWHPHKPIFATASTPGSKIVNKSTRSVVRVYEPLNSIRLIVEYECPALDMNDVTFCPDDSNYITASCTDGITYVWDYRMPDEILHELKHGDPITPLKPDLTREQSDMGIRLALWGQTGDRFYTGSSDGVVKSWNIKLAPEDAHIQDVAQFEAGVMCGAFSPDHSNLLVGDARGSIHILSSAPESQHEGMEEIDFEPASCSDIHIVSKNDGSLSTEMADAARALLATGELSLHPTYGAGKGPNYKGPYAAYARNATPKPNAGTDTDAEAEEEEEPSLKAEFQKLQLCDHQRSLAGPDTPPLSAAERRQIIVQQELARARNVVGTTVRESGGGDLRRDGSGVGFEVEEESDAEAYLSDGVEEEREGRVLRKIY
ncbi:MAG: hypothetical protein M1827_002089 [Pycnora praestabilis]|nr:MAG: hypothetical protein M1827_002089 [Pycnora praestabilis]